MMDTEWRCSYPADAENAPVSDLCSHWLVCVWLRHLPIGAFFRGHPSGRGHRFKARDQEFWETWHRTNVSFGRAAVLTDSRTQR